MCKRSAQVNIFDWPVFTLYLVVPVDHAEPPVIRAGLEAAELRLRRERRPSVLQDVCQRPKEERVQQVYILCKQKYNYHLISYLISNFSDVNYVQTFTQIA